MGDEEQNTEVRSQESGVRMKRLRATVTDFLFFWLLNSEF
jgi:hypothetical protein